MASWLGSWNSIINEMMEYSIHYKKDSFSPYTIDYFPFYIINLRSFLPFHSMIKEIWWKKKLWASFWGSSTPSLLPSTDDFTCTSNWVSKSFRGKSRIFLNPSCLFEKIFFSKHAEEKGQNYSYHPQGLCGWYIMEMMSYDFPAPWDDKLLLHHPK